MNLMALPAIAQMSKLAQGKVKLTMPAILQSKVVAQAKKKAELPDGADAVIDSASQVMPVVDSQPTFEQALVPTVTEVTSSGIGWALLALGLGVLVLGVSRFTARPKRTESVVQGMSGLGLPPLPVQRRVWRKSRSRSLG